MKASDQRGHPLAPPTIDQLFITETGDIGIEPRPPGRAAQAPRALSQLVDELLPADRVASEILSPAHAHVYGFTTSHAPHANRSSANAAIANPGDERAVLRHLFDRAQDELDAPGPIEPPPHAADTVSPPALPVEPVADSPRIAVVFEDASDLRIRRGGRARHTTGRTRGAGRRHACAPRRRDPLVHAVPLLRRARSGRADRSGDTFSGRHCPRRGHSA